MDSLIVNSVDLTVILIEQKLQKYVYWKPFRLKKKLYHIIKNNYFFEQVENNLVFWVIHYIVNQLNINYLFFDLLKIPIKIKIYNQFILCFGWSQYLNIYFHMHYFLSVLTSCELKFAKPIVYGSCYLSRNSLTF